MIEDVQNIGRFNYLWTIFTGKNLQIAEIKKRIYNKDKYDEENIEGDFIITIGNRAVILTKYRNGRREPMIVRKWRKAQNDNIGNFISSFAPLANSSFKVNTFIDSAGYQWRYYVDHKRWITVHEPDSGELIYEIEIK